MSAEEPVCGTTLLDAHNYYLKEMKGYLDTLICLIGSIFNILNILVFTRRNMISPVNLIFTHLAFADLSMLLAHILYSWVKVSAYYRNESYTTAVLLLRSVELIYIFHPISVCLITMLAIWKYIAVFHPSKESQWCDMKTTRNTVMAIYIACVSLAIPFYLSHYVKTYDVSVYKTSKEYIYVPMNKYDSTEFAIWMGIRVTFYELLPIVVLAISSVRLIFVLWIKKGHSNLSSNVENSTDNVEIQQKTNGSVIILIIIMTLCLSFVIPIELLDLLVVYTVLKQDWRFSYIHMPCVSSLYTVLHILRCINTSATFIVYYIMDRDFKVTFKSLFEKYNIFTGKRKDFVLNDIRTNESSRTDQV